MNILNRKYVGYTAALWRFDQRDILPGFVEYMSVEEFQAVEIQLDRTPWVVLKQLGEIVEKLVGCQVADLAIEIIAESPYGSGVGVNGLWLQAFEFQVLFVFSVMAFKDGITGHFGVHCNLLE